ncbi:salivary peroxidase/catechol oxidase-like isoform X2 [Oratosquilla oratoria]
MAPVAKRCLLAQALFLATQVLLQSQAEAQSHQRHSRSVILFPEDPKPVQVPCMTYDRKSGLCRPLVLCSTFYAEIAELSRSPCEIKPGKSGVCCLPDKKEVKDAGFVISFRPTPQAVSFPKMEKTAIDHACEMGLKKASDYEAFENQLLQNNIVAPKESSAAIHAKLFQTRPEVVTIAKKANEVLQATGEMMKNFNLTKEQGEFAMDKLQVRDTIMQGNCPREPVCPETRYRTIDGSCNNLRNKRWGQAAIPFERLLPANYADGFNDPRKASDGGDLPSPRKISTHVIVPNEGNRYKNLTLLVMQWGQFLDHDITHTPITKGKAMSDIVCCENGRKRVDFVHPACLPIEIPADDPFFKHHGQLCMEFVRSFPTVNAKCTFGHREQMNQISAFIDASNVYGSTEEEVRELRTFKNGLLKTGVHNLLPPHRSECFNELDDQQVCFKAGDSRVNEQPNLAVLHTIWVRQHNQLAERLQQLNPHWTDEVVFQETRRIVAAQMQHITYNEYLPIILGRSFIETFGLITKKSGYSTSYNSSVNPSITNAFATAAFRYGHTLIADSFEAYTQFGRKLDQLELSKNQFKPYSLYEKFDSLVRGLSFQQSQKFDNLFSKELTTRLFAGNRKFGMDLVALNIQRGRDHGIPGYNDWRELCGLTRAKSWTELDGVMPKEMRIGMQEIYRSIDDIDLFVGAIAERPLADSIIGPTFLCIIGDQFTKLRVGDRFYYENGGLESSFTEDQLAEIRKISLARVLCDSSEDLHTMQPLAFVMAHLANKRAGCRGDARIPNMSLEPWKNEGTVWI